MEKRMTDFGGTIDGHTSTRVRDGLPVATYLAGSLLDDAALETIHGANRAFLALVAEAGRATPSGGVFALPTHLTLQLMTLSPGALAGIARCPYTLYTLKFSDAAFWRSIALEVAGNPVSAETPRGGSAQFARTAVFLAWHFAQGSELTAALVLGMTPAVQEAWRGLPFTGIERAAMAAAPYLEARWGAHARFWPGLLDSAEEGDEAAAEKLRLLGLQLLATDGLRSQLPPSRRARRVAVAGSG